jgi:hypothetical protein
LVVHFLTLLLLAVLAVAFISAGGNAEVEGCSHKLTLADSYD